jgi:hypothetical protein
MSAAEHREPYELRGSRTVLGARGGESPLRDSPCVTNTLTEKEVWSCMRDEGRPLEVGSQVQASNRCKLRPLRATVVSVAEKPGQHSGRYDPERRAQANRR